MKKILFVDDEPNILAGFQRQLRRQFQVETALGPHAGLAALKNTQDYAVVVADMRMPEMNGIEFLVQVRRLAPDVVRMMLTGNVDQATAVEAINSGNIFRFLNKPCAPEHLVAAIEAAFRQYQLITAERDLLEHTLSGSVKVLTEVLALVEPRAFGQAEALRKDMRELATFMQAGPVWQFELAALLSQIGHITLPPDVALKIRSGQPVTPHEQDILDRLPSVGGNLLAHIPRLEEVSKIILYQNKRFDGSGFPDDKIAGDAIPLGSRLLKVLADLAHFQNLGAPRAAALRELRTRPGWYDSGVLDSVEGCFHLKAQTPAADAPVPLAVGFADLRVDHLLVTDLLTRDGTLIIAAGSRITKPLLQRLRNFSSLSGIREPIHVEA